MLVRVVRAASVAPLRVEGRIAGSVRGSKGIVEVETSPGDTLYPEADQQGAESDKWRKSDDDAPKASEADGKASSAVTEAAAPAPLTDSGTAPPVARKKWVRLNFHISEVLGSTQLRAQDEVYFIPVRNPKSGLRPSEAPFMARRVQLKNPRDPREEALERERMFAEDNGGGGSADEAGGGPARTKPKFGGQLTFRQAKKPDGTRGFALGRGRPLASPPPGLALSTSATSLGSDGSGAMDSPRLKTVGSASLLNATAPSFSPIPRKLSSGSLEPNAPEFSPKGAS